MPDNNVEIEVKFLEIDVAAITAKLHSLNARDLGEDHLREIIFYDKELEWQKNRKQEARMVRLRQSKRGVRMSYKNHRQPATVETEEIELTVNNIDQAKAFLEAIGLVPYREQEKQRHSFLLGQVQIELDTWPQIPTYIEIEGSSEEELRIIAEQLGFDWNKAVFKNAGDVIEDIYHIPVGKLKTFTFQKQE